MKKQLGADGQLWDVLSESSLDGMFSVCLLRDGEWLAVQYGHQWVTFTLQRKSQACDEFIRCVRHQLECAGAFDQEDEQ